MSYYNENDLEPFYIILKKQVQMNSKLLQLARMVLKLSEIKTDKALLITEEDIDIEVPVFIEDEAGELIPAEDGEYIAEDGRVIVIVEGKVSEIREKEEEQPKEEVVVEQADEEVVEEEVIEEPDPKDARIAELEALVEDMRKQIEDKDIEIEDLKAKLGEKEEEVKMAKQVPAFKENVVENVNVSLADAVKKVYNKK